MSNHTHVGCKAHVGSYQVDGGLNWERNHDPRPGRRHALTGGPDEFRSLCGEWVLLRDKDMYGDPIVPNVRPVGDVEARPVTCKRCLRLLGGR